MCEESDARRRGRCAVLLVVGYAVVVVLPFGCTTYQRSQQDVEVAVNAWQRRQVAAASLAPATPAATPARMAVVEERETPADRPVDAYIRAALERNPAVKAATAEVRAKLERIPQATALPDPILRAAVRPEPIQTAAGDVYFTLGVAQTIPWLAKLERAGDVAAADTRVAIERLNEKRIQIIADVERAYWQVYRLDRYVEIARENRRMLEDLEGVVNTQYRVGRVQQQDLLRVQTEWAKLRDDEARYVLRRGAAAAALNQLTDCSPQREIAATLPVDVPRVRADVERLMVLAEENNPELARLREQVERDRERVLLAELGYWPDLTLGFEWNYVRPREPFIPPVNPTTGVRPAINRKSEAGGRQLGGNAANEPADLDRSHRGGQTRGPATVAGDAERIARGAEHGGVSYLRCVVARGGAAADVARA